jgi:hypothetical protein
MKSTHTRRRAPYFEGTMFERRTGDEERVLRRYIEATIAFSETAPSISLKLGVRTRTARRVLDRYAEIGAVQRRTLGGRIEPIYSRYQIASRAS